MSRQRLRCAIYTRKSTDEGLDQDFNSLDAQREACEAYIASQAGEGWHLIRTRYDDGAYSGATLDRPALQKLFEAIKAQKVDTVVVYKVDRLTRSLADFARIVELFDANHVSFVSITQQFNTTTSMGRLTLNMLLSFAQFEREVTGERIRDKIAASKKKGMWMGGVVPLGYDVIDRKLIINEAEAKTVRTIFRLYLELANVRLVKEQADKLDLRTKLRKPNNGRRLGGEPFTRGHIYKLLSNPVYVGEISHKGQTYSGEHEPIIGSETWDAVQKQLDENAVIRRHGTNSKTPSLLAGLLFDDQSNRLKPSHANKRGRRYRYYVSARVETGSSDGKNGWRLPAGPVEDAVLTGLRTFLGDKPRLTKALMLKGRGIREKLDAASDLRDQLGSSAPADQRAILLKIISRIEIEPTQVGIVLLTEPLNTLLSAVESGHRRASKPTKRPDEYRLDIPVSFKRRGVEMKLLITDETRRRAEPDPKMIKAIAQGHHWFTQLKSGEVKSVRDLVRNHEVNQGDISRMLPLGLLAPDIVEAILAGHHPPALTASRLKRLRDLPISWDEQRQALGFE